MPEPLEPKSAARRKTEEGMELAAAAVPFAGGVLSVRYAQLFRRADQRRFEQWQQQMDETLDKLRSAAEGRSIESLFDDDDFVDSLAAATRIAERNASDEKRRCLQNALFNVGRGAAPAADKCAIFFRYVEDLTPSHMQLMRFLDNPPRYFQDHDLGWPNVGMGALMSVVQVAFPEWAADEAFLMTLAGDLESRGLVESPGFKTVMTADGLRTQRSTAKGIEFAQFVSGPFPAPRREKMS